MQVGNHRTPRTGELRSLAFYTLFSPSIIYILFAYSFRILVQNRVYVLEYGKNMAPNNLEHLTQDLTVSGLSMIRLRLPMLMLP